MSDGRRVWLSGFFLLGMLLGLLGPLLVVWRYQIDVEPHLIGLHFLALNAGYVVAAAVSSRLLRRIVPSRLALGASVLALAALIALAFAAPPVSTRWRLALLFCAGLAAGALAGALLYGSEHIFRASSLAAAFRAALLFGLGCLLATVLCGATYFVGFSPFALLALAVVPCVYAVLFWRVPAARAASAGAPSADPLEETLSDLRSIATVLFSFLVFFQFGNEWAIAGWLPLFLIHRLGSNPALSIGVLAVYFATLAVGRVTALRLMPLLHRRRFLLASIALAVCGFILLELARSLAAATIAAIVIGAGFAAIYPLISEQLDQRFSYHPGFYNGTTSIAVTGAMSTPWLLGFVAASYGMGYVMLLPAIGSVVVLLLALLLMYEAHLMREKTPPARIG
ncbi:MAG TPA: MFS transporter [Bryobacteraceae bacterium]|jgi:fucose permease|nr:MFS transporter [Bryobacteraceae bacterium]